MTAGPEAASRGRFRRRGGTGRLRQKRSRACGSLICQDMTGRRLCFDTCPRRTYTYRTSAGPGSSIHMTNTVPSLRPQSLPSGPCPRRGDRYTDIPSGGAKRNVHERTAFGPPAAWGVRKKPRPVASDGASQGPFGPGSAPGLSSLPHL